MPLAKHDQEFSTRKRKDMRIDRPKAIAHFVKNPKRAILEKLDEELEIPSEFITVKNFMAGKPKQNLKKEHIFDTTEDGKPIKVKKVSRAEKLKTPFKMLDGKKFHDL